jgi:hypothetical protein
MPRAPPPPKRLGPKACLELPPAMAFLSASFPARVFDGVPATPIPAGGQIPVLAGCRLRLEITIPRHGPRDQTWISATCRAVRMEPPACAALFSLASKRAYPSARRCR